MEPGRVASRWSRRSFYSPLYQKVLDCRGPLMKPRDREGTVVYTFLDRTEADMGIPQSLLNCVVFLSTLVPLSAQWLSYPTPGIPRTPDGKPNLSAPAPKTADGKPDLSGIWETA